MLKLLTLLFVFLCAAPLRATTIVLSTPGTNNGLSVIVIPDGSEITSETYQAPGTTTATGRWIVTYAFADGHGDTWNDTNDGGQGSIHFNTPVSNLILNWTTSTFFTTVVEGTYYNACPGFTNCMREGTAVFNASDITELSWDSLPYGYGGVTSMSYTVPEQVTEPSSLALLPLGLLGVLLVYRPKRPRERPSRSLDSRF